MKPRLFLLLLCGLLAVAAVTSGGCSNTKAAPEELPLEADGGTVINRYHVPPLPGWNRQTTQPATRSIRRVTYRREVEGTEITMKFIWFNAPKARLDSTEKLKAKADELERYNKEAGRNTQLLESRDTTYQSLPALLRRQLTRRKGKVTETKILRIADGQGGLWFTQSLSAVGTSAQAISGRARAQADAAWKTLTEGLKPASTTSKE